MSKLSPWYYVLAFAVVLVVYKAFFMKPKVRHDVDTAPIVENRPVTQIEVPRNGSVANQTAAANNMATSPSASTATTVTPKPVIDIPEQRRKESEALVQEVTKKAGLKFPFPQDMQYGKLDMGDGFLGMYGRNDKTKGGLAFVATRKDARPEEIMQFVQDSRNAIPNLQDNIRWSQAKPKSFDASSGLSGATTWTGVDSHGNSVVMALVNRADHQGSYLFIQNGNSAQTIDNEGYYEQMKSQIVAEPVPAGEP